MSRRDWPTAQYILKLTGLYAGFCIAAGLTALIAVIVIVHPAWIVAFILGAATLAFVKNFRAIFYSIAIEVVVFSSNLFFIPRAASQFRRRATTDVSARRH